MKAEVICEAKTIAEAISKAIQELNTDESNVEIEILQEPGKGLFGKTKPAKVMVKIKGNEEQEKKPVAKEIAIKEGEEVLKEILDLMGIKDAEIKTQHKEDEIVLMDIKTEAGGLIIGKQGQTLSSLQHLINKIVKPKDAEKVKYILDVGGYRDRHHEILENMAASSAQKVVAKKEKVVLEEMNAFDRRIIHMYFKDNPEVMTYSEGEGNYKRVVISPKNQG